jgi:outer membrane receptor for ferric coprogen and ferric-rhodotorulic acid
LRESDSSVAQEVVVLSVRSRDNEGTELEIEVKYVPDWLIKLGYSVEIKVQRSKRPRVQVAIGPG